jgi:WD40 repeat protein
MDSERHKRSVADGGDNGDGGHGEFSEDLRPPAKKHKAVKKDAAAEESFSGVYLAVSSKYSVQLRDGSTGTLLGTIKTHRPIEFCEINFVCIDPTNTMIVTCHTVNKLSSSGYRSCQLFRIWDLRSCQEIRTIEYMLPTGVLHGQGNKIAFNSTGSQFITSWQRVFDTHTGELIAVLSEKDAQIYSFCYSSDDSMLIVGACSEIFEVTLRDATTGKVLRCLENSYGHHEILLNRAGSTLLSHDGQEVCTWDYQSGQRVCSFHVEGSNVRKSSIADICCNHDGTMVLIGLRGWVRMYDLQTGEMVRGFHISRRRVATNVAFNACNDAVIAICSGMVRVWKASASSKAPIQTLKAALTNNFWVFTVTDIILSSSLAILM